MTAIEQLTKLRKYVEQNGYSYFYGYTHYKLMPEQTYNCEFKLKVVNKRKEHLAWYNSPYKIDELEIKEVLCIIEGENFMYSLPANTYFIDEIIKGLKGKTQLKREKYNEAQLEPPKVVKSEWVKIGSFDINLLKKAHKFIDPKHFCDRNTIIHFDCENIVSTNGIAMFYKPCPMDKPFNISEKEYKIVSKWKGLIEVYGDGLGQIRLAYGENELIYENTYVDYPNYKSIIPSNKLKFSVNKKELTKCIKSIEKYSNQASKLIELTFNGNTLRLLAQDIDFNYSSSTKLIIDNISNITGSIGFKSDYLLDCLSVSDSETVDIWLNDEKSCTLIGGVLLMPMMLTGEPIKGIEHNESTIELVEALFDNAPLNETFYDDEVIYINNSFIDQFKPLRSNLNIYTIDIDKELNYLNLISTFVDEALCIDTGVGYGQVRLAYDAVCYSVLECLDSS